MRFSIAFLRVEFWGCLMVVFHCWEGATSEYSEGGMDGENSKTSACLYEEKDERNDGDAASSSLLGISGVLR
jgi:hypothetical protein